MPPSQPGAPRRWTRSLASLVASLLGLVAVCLVVFGTSQKQLQIGVLLGLWAGLIAAFLMVGPRRGQAEHAARLAEAEQRARELHEAQLQVSQFQQAQLAAAEESRGRHEVELRKLGEMQLSRETASRREADLQLELSLRREIQRMMNEQIGLLRNEVAALRAEVVDKLGGQLRLERIETTRLIGSDLEALQHEIRRLAGQESIGAGPAQLTSGMPRISLDRGELVEHRDSERYDAQRYDSERYDSERYDSARPDSQGSDWVERYDDGERYAPVEREAEAQRHVDQPAPERQPVRDADRQLVRDADRQPDRGADRQLVRDADRQPDRGADRQPAWSAPTVVNAESKTPASGRPAEPTPSDPFDLLAGLPRLSPLPADLELIPDPPRQAEAAESRRPADQAAAGYHGRRRAADEDGEQPAAGGGRRRAPDDAPDDLLARLRRS